MNIWQYVRMTVCMKRLIAACLGIRTPLAISIPNLRRWVVHYQAVSGPAPGVLGALKKHFPGHLQMLPLRIAVGYRTKNLHGGWGISRQWSDGASVLWSEGSYIYDNIHVHIVIHSYTQTKKFFSIRKWLLHGAWGFQGSGHRGVSHPGADRVVGPHHL